MQNDRSEDLQELRGFCSVLRAMRKQAGKKLRKAVVREAKARGYTEVRFSGYKPSAYRGETYIPSADLEDFQTLDEMYKECVDSKGINANYVQTEGWSDA